MLIRAVRSYKLFRSFSGQKQGNGGHGMHAKVHEKVVERNDLSMEPPCSHSRNETVRKTEQPARTGVCVSNVAVA